MLIVRAARLADLDQMLELSNQTGTGMTTMPTDLVTWEKKLAKSVKDFAKKVENPHGEIYFLVMEDSDTQEVVGSCAVYAGVGLDRPFYSYKLSTLTTSSQKLNMTIYTRVLHLVNDYTGGTELGSLFLKPEYRKNGNGRFLSRSRLMLIANYPQRFGEQIFAELRGWLDDNGESPFWDHLGRKFFGMSYEKADFTSAVDGSQFISDLMPKYPVYLDLLPKAAQDVVGKPHKDAVPALKILENEGFQYTGYVDIFDAGPCIQAHRDQINSIKNKQIAKVVQISADAELNSDANTSRYIISNHQLIDYHAVAQPMQIITENQVSISQAVADCLQLKTGSELNYIAL